MMDGINPAYSSFSSLETAENGHGELNFPPAETDQMMVVEDGDIFEMTITTGNYRLCKAKTAHDSAGQN